MAVTTLTVQDIARSGLTPALAAANTDGSYVPNNGRVFLQVKNAAGSSITVTVASQKTILGLAVADVTVTVPATTGDKMIGPFPPDVFNDAQGQITVTFSAVSSVTVAAFRL